MYYKIVKNQVGFQVIPCLKPIHMFSLEWKLATWNPILLKKKQIDTLRGIKNTKVKVLNYA
jgi:hypothetical protein